MKLAGFLRCARALQIAAATLALAVALPGSAAEAEKEKTDKEAARANLEQALRDAQKRLDEAAREVANLSMSLSGEHMPGFAHVSGKQRAVLGVAIGRSDRAD